MGFFLSLIKKKKPSLYGDDIWSVFSYFKKQDFCFFYSKNMINAKNPLCIKGSNILPLPLSDEANDSATSDNGSDEATTTTTTTPSTTTDDGDK